MDKALIQTKEVSKSTVAGRWAKRLIHRSMIGRRAGKNPKMKRIEINSELCEGLRGRNLGRIKRYDYTNTPA